MGFDPYRDWLGIDASDGVPNHYQLLGVPLFESSQDRIRAAAGDRTELVSKRRMGQRQADALRLLAEISEAFDCLVEPSRKAAYDLQLRALDSTLIDETHADGSVHDETSSDGSDRAAVLPPSVGVTHPPIPPSWAHGTAVPTGATPLPVQAVATEAERNDQEHSRLMFPRRRVQFAAACVFALLVALSVFVATRGDQQIMIDDQSVHDVVLNEGESVTIEPKLMESASQQVCYEFVGELPAGAEFVSTTGKLTWMPGEGDGGKTYAIAIRATVEDDPENFDIAAAVIQVREGKGALVLSPLPTITVSLGQTAKFSAHASSVQSAAGAVNRSVKYVLSEDAPPGSRIDEKSGEFTWTPAASGEFRFHIVARVEGAAPQQQEQIAHVVVEKPRTESPSAIASSSKPMPDPGLSEPPAVPSSMTSSIAGPDNTSNSLPASGSASVSPSANGASQAADGQLPGRLPSDVRLGQLLYSNEFDEPANGLSPLASESSSGVHRASRLALVGTAGVRGGIMEVAMPLKIVGDYVCYAKARLTRGGESPSNAWALVFRDDGAGRPSFYVYMSGQGARVASLPANYAVLHSRPTTLDTTEWHSVFVVRRGNSIRIVLDDVDLGEMASTDPNVASGNITTMLRVRAFDSSTSLAEAEFESIKIWQLNSGMAGPSLASSNPPPTTTQTNSSSAQRPAGLPNDVALGPMVYADDFNDSSSGMRQLRSTDGSRIDEYASGKFRMTLVGPDPSSRAGIAIHTSSTKKIVNDFVCEATVRLIGDGSDCFELWFRSTPDSNKTLKIKITADGRVQSCGTPDSSGDLNSPIIQRAPRDNTLLIVKRRRQLHLFVNGRELASPLPLTEDYTDAELSFATVVWGRAPQTIVAEVDSVRLWSLGGSSSGGSQSAAIDRTIVVNSIDMPLVLIQPGTFQMGETPVAEPVHAVRITKPFLMGVYEVTQGQYKKVTRGRNPSTFAPANIPQGYSWTDLSKVPDWDKLPVESVTWTEAKTFCETLSKDPAERAAGRKYRLPTEAEWEYACRAGTTSTFNTGRTLSSKDANSLATRSTFEYDDWFINGKVQTPHPLMVGLFNPNAWGLHDMHGNVAEWCADRHDPLFYSKSPADDPECKLGRNLSARGGAFNLNDPACSSAIRHSFSGAERRHNVGFRVVCELLPKSE